MDIRVLQSSSGHPLNTYIWTPTTPPRAILLISHGMAEHAQRYDHLGHFLANKNILVCAHDQLGHGKTAQEEHRLGHIPPQSWKHFIDDIQIVLNHAKRYGQDLPIFLLGHSMGSYIAQGFAQNYGDQLSGLVLSGSSFESPLATGFGAIFCGILGKILGSHAPATFIQKAIFTSYNLTVKKRKTDYDWLSQNEENVQRYIADPLCGFICSLGFFNTLFAGLNEIYRKKNMAKLPHDCPIHFLSGEEDPLGKKKKSVTSCAERYKLAGHPNVTTEFFPSCRHEILNEGIDEVYEAIFSKL